MRLTRKAAVVGAMFALTSVFTLAACSDDSEPGIVDLSGAYEVTAIWQGLPGETPVLTPITGTADLTSTTYDIDIPGVASSEGDYEAFDDGTFTQDGTTTVPGQEPIATQCSGTYSIVNSVLTIDATCQGVRTVTQLEPLD
jgi:hypothetical protein